MLRSRLAALATVAVAATSVALVAATPAAAAGCTYVAEPLALPVGVTSALVSATDGNTTFAGRSITGGRQQLIVWRDGVPEKLPQQSGSLDLTGINAAGDVVGGRSSEAGTGSPLWYHAGAFQPASVFGDESPALYGINAAGDIAGLITRDGARKVAVWRTGHQADPPVVLPAPDGFFPTIPQIGDDGSVAVFGLVGSAGYGYVWAPDGTRRALTPPLGGTVSRVAGIRGHRIVGSALGYGAVEWDLSGALLATPGTPTTEGFAVTSAGTVLMSDRQPGEQATVPVVAAPGTDWQYLPAPAGSTRANAGSITEGGVVGGTYVDAATGKTLPVQWKCTP
ncbi:hypothetical protein QRX60_09365 [Amycolatopsis mongoliensis]|uniref:Uncharacterized protein n=1 Tax=Amycolatopsis mongoliensis TaxID=715475 RepID=A0A9Y2NLP8_9PSEU|nr:hypothetical protein [Amycolatopsis sp. 4-36]WIY04038.1 hypothetical protein QRX60_09365 [Amycolatopsis sp. 4-36]